MSEDDSASERALMVASTVNDLAKDLAKPNKAGRPDLPPLQAEPQLRTPLPSPVADGPQPTVPTLGSDGPDPAGMRPTASDARSGSEIELKLLTDADHLESFREAPVIAGNAKNRGVRRHLRAVYYDTEDRRLRKAGLSLRVRQSGSRFTQTVKAESIDNPLRRGEWEAAVPTAEPDLSLALPFFPQKLRGRLVPEMLQPVFSTDIHRLSRSVSLPSGTVEVSFDHGILRAGDRTLPVNEIEIELKEGATQTLYDLALRLMEHGPLRPSVRGKAARGFDLADQVAPKAPKPDQPVLDPGAPLDETLTAILSGAHRHLLQSLPAAEDGQNPEGVHQARVALRRLRSIFGLMRSVAASPSLETFRAEAKWLADRLAAARDADIFVNETLRSIERSLPDLDGFTDLRKVAEVKRSDGYAAARAALAEQRTGRFLLELGGWIEKRGWRCDVSPETLGALGDPAVAFADHTLARLHAKVMKRGRHFKSMTPEERHQFRIAVKKLRYASDFLMPIYGRGKAVKRFTGHLVALQDELGRYNDMATTRALVASLGDGPAGRSQAAGAVIGWQAQGLASAEPRLRSAWRDFCELRPPWAESATGP